MRGLKEKSSNLQMLVLVTLLGICVLALESQDLHYMLPRELSSPKETRNSVSSTQTLPKGTLPFAKSISCRLPLPGRTNDDSNNTSRNDNGHENCVKFFPERFFATVAADFRLSYNESKLVKTEHPVIHLTFQANSSDGTETSSILPAGDGTLYPATISYFHIRKCGGTTMFRSLSTKALQVPYISNNYSRKMIQSMGIVQDIYDRQSQQQQQQQSSQSGDAIVFSFVRDPVIRFLSSVGQMLHMGKVQLFPKCNNLSRIEQVFAVREPNATLAKSQALVHCILESIQSTPPIDSSSKENTRQPQSSSFNYIDQHLLPQAFELRARSLEYDLGIELLPMSHISSMLKTLVGAEKQNRHARPSRVADYTQGYLLEASVLTDDMISDICHIYAVDVLLLQTTSVASSLCDSSAIV